MTQIFKKQFLLTGFLEYLIQKHLQKSVKIITPGTVEDRGSQLSLEFDRDLQDVHNELDAKNVVVSLFPTICNYSGYFLKMNNSAGYQLKRNFVDPLQNTFHSLPFKSSHQ